MKVSSEAYPSLQKFLIESALYEHVGLNFETLKHRPLREVLDYTTIVNIIVNEKNRLAKKSAADASRAGRS